MLRLAKANVAGGGHTKSCGWRGCEGRIKNQFGEDPRSGGVQKQARKRVVWLRRDGPGRSLYDASRGVQMSSVLACLVETW